MVQGDEDGYALGKVQGTLAHHLYRDQIKNLQSRGLWPAGFAAEPATVVAPAPPTAVIDGAQEYGNEYGTFGDDGDLFVNRNRQGSTFDGLSESENEEEYGDDDDDEAGAVHQVELEGTDVEPANRAPPAAELAGEVGLTANTTRELPIEQLADLKVVAPP